MSFCNEDVPLDYAVFTGAATFLLRRIEADPPTPLAEQPESLFRQGGVPLAHEVRSHAAWLLRMTQRCCFSLTSFLGALVYIERLRRARKLTLYESTWRSTWVAMSVLSEKRWEDNYVHPGHVHATYGSTHTSQDQLLMQIALFKALDYRLAIGGEEFTIWLARLRAEVPDPQILNVVHFQRVFIPRPIPNLKVRKDRTPSTSAGSETARPLSDWAGRPASTVHLGCGAGLAGLCSEITPRSHISGAAGRTYEALRHPAIAATPCRGPRIIDTRPADGGALRSSRIMDPWPADTASTRCSREVLEQHRRQQAGASDFWQVDLRMAELRLRTSAAAQQRTCQWEPTSASGYPNWTRAPHLDVAMARPGVVAWC